MGAALTTPFLNLPQWEGNEYFTRLDMNDAFASIEKATATFDKLSDTYGYTLTIQNNEDNTVFTETVKSGSPITALRVTTKSTVDGVLQFRKQITIGETVTFFTEKKTADGWEGSVE